MKEEMVLVIDDEPVTRAGVAAAVGATGRTVITCGDIESAQLVMERMPIRSVVTDMRLTGPFSIDGLDFIDFVTRHAPQSRVVLMTGSYSPELHREARQRGAVAVLEKPFTTEQIDAVLSSAALHPSGLPDIIDVPVIDDVLSGTSLFSVFQPIVSLQESEPVVVGFEALSRVDTAGPLRVPDFLFEYSLRKRRMTELELRCVDNSIRNAAGLPGDGLLFLNIHPTVLAERQLVDAIAAATARAGIAPERLVVEITEQSAMRDLPATMENIDALAASGCRFAFDDIGVAYSHFLHLERIRPAFMKISQEFGTDFHRNDFKRKIVRNVLNLARDFGCDVILEGIETPDVAAAARELGIPLAQGFYFGRPQPAASWRTS